MKALSHPKLYIFCAFPCEAKPIIDCYKLKKDATVNAFNIFQNNEIALTVTGIGKIAMAAAIAYTQALFASVQNPIMLNIGIAGHKHHDLGRLFLADKISDNDTNRSYYPPLNFTPPCPTISVTTFFKPQHAYPEASLCDMEASAFYETASRFSTGELIQSLKIVSDNETTPALNIQPKQVTELINQHLTTIKKVVNDLTQLSQLLISPDLIWLDAITSQFHFSVNEQIQLKKLLQRLQVTQVGYKLEAMLNSANSGKDVLSVLKNQLDEVKFYL